MRYPNPVSAFFPLDWPFSIFFIQFYCKFWNYWNNTYDQFALVYQKIRDLQIHNNFNISLKMQQMLEQLIITEDQQLLQKYIHKYLTNNNEDLKRIYTQLKKYNPELIPPNNTETRQIRKKTRLTYKQRVSNENMIKRTKSLMLNLKDKGIKTSNEMSEKGVEIFEKKHLKIISPLKKNPTTLLFKQSNFNHLFLKFELNRKYYSKETEGSGVAFEPEMIEFIARRKKLLDQIEKGHFYESTQPPAKYRSKTSKLLNKNHFNKFTKLNTELPVIISAQQQASIKNGAIIEECNNFFKYGQNGQNGQNGSNKSNKSNKSNNNNSNRTASQVNHFAEMQSKLEVDFNENNDIDAAVREKVREMLVKQQYDRYNPEYIRYLRMKPNLCKMNKHEKDLLQNQIKMRPIIIFNE